MEKKNIELGHFFTVEGQDFVALRGYDKQLYIVPSDGVGKWQEKEFRKSQHPSPVSLDTHTAEEDFYRWWALHFFGLSVPYPDYIPLLKQFLKEATTGKPSLNRAIGSDSGDDLNRPLLTGVRKASDPHAFTTDPEVQNWLKSLDEETYLMCQAITDLCDRRHNTRLKFEVNKIVQEYASLRENKALKWAYEMADKLRNSAEKAPKDDYRDGYFKAITNVRAELNERLKKPSL